MKTYLVVKNELGLEIGEYPIDTRKELAKEVARILIDEDIILNDDDVMVIVRR